MWRQLETGLVWIQVLALLSDLSFERLLFGRHGATGGRGGLDTRRANGLGGARHPALPLSLNHLRI